MNERDRTEEKVALFLLREVYRRKIEQKRVIMQEKCEMKLQVEQRR